MNVVDQSQIVVAEEECVRSETEDGAGAAVDERLSVVCSEETGDEVARLAVRGSEAHNFVAGADMRMAGSMESD